MERSDVVKKTASSLVSLKLSQKTKCCSYCAATSITLQFTFTLTPPGDGNNMLISSKESSHLKVVLACHADARVVSERKNMVYRNSA